MTPNQYRCDKVRTCGSCHYSVFEPEGMFCNHHEPYFKTRLDSWTREPPVWCPLPVYQSESERDKVLDEGISVIEKRISGIFDAYRGEENEKITERPYAMADGMGEAVLMLKELRQAGEQG